MYIMHPTRKERKQRKNLRNLANLKRRRIRRPGDRSLEVQEEKLPTVGVSEVYRENPYEVGDFSPPMRMDVGDFWAFVCRAPWQGRLRVCDGVLMRKLIDTFENLVQNKIINKVLTTRTFSKSELIQRKNRLFHSAGPPCELDNQDNLVVKTTFTYYGGLPLRKHRKVSFQLTPNSVYTPRIRHSLPIIKYKSTDIRRNSKVEAVMKLQSQFATLFPRMAWDQDSGESHDEWFISPIPADFAEKCLKAAQEYVIVKEQFTDSDTWRTVTSITLSRKETKYKTYLACNAMNSMYTSEEFPMFSYALEKRALIPKSLALPALRVSR